MPDPLLIGPSVCVIARLGRRRRTRARAAAVSPGVTAVQRRAGGAARGQTSHAGAQASVAASPREVIGASVRRASALLAAARRAHAVGVPAAVARVSSQRAPLPEAPSARGAHALAGRAFGAAAGRGVRQRSRVAAGVARERRARRRASGRGRRDAKVCWQLALALAREGQAPDRAAGAAPGAAGRAAAARSRRAAQPHAAPDVDRGEPRGAAAAPRVRLRLHWRPGPRRRPSRARRGARRGRGRACDALRDAMSVPPLELDDAHMERIRWWTPSTRTTARPTIAR